MSDTRICRLCNINIAGDACSCPCGVFYHLGCIGPAFSKSDKRRCCLFKSTQSSSKSLSPISSTGIILDQFEKMWSDHYRKAKTDSETFISCKINDVGRKVIDLTETVSTFLTVLWEELTNWKARFRNYRMSTISYIV